MDPQQHGIDLLFLIKKKKQRTSNDDLIYEFDLE